MKNAPLLTLIVVIAVAWHGVVPAAALADGMFSDEKDLQTWVARLSHRQPPHPTASHDPGSDVARFYRLVGCRPVWAGPGGLRPNGEVLVQAIAKAPAAGLDLADYALPELEAAKIGIVQGPGDRPWAATDACIRLDVLFTDRIIRFARHLAQGRVAPEQIHRQWRAQRRSISRDIPFELAQAVKNDCLRPYLESLHPQREAYQRLRSALRQYEKIRRSGGWLPIDAGPTLRQGDTGPRVAMLKVRLKMAGDGFDAGPIETDAFDQRVTVAVRHFQRRHGLKEDGLVGRETLAALNTPVEKRIDQLRLNMERWRWLPDSFGNRYLMVNIPAFELTIVDSGQPIERIRAIVGRKDRQTPIMSEQMTYIEFNPYWNIPQTIARRDILPKAKQDPSYLIRQGIRIFDGWDRDARELRPTRVAWNQLSVRHFPYRLRQDPSRRNALGRIKFIFPNPQSIYIHDTPGKSLFHRQVRAFSSGCVRLEKPITLAHHLLNDQGWDRNRLDAVTARKKRRSEVLSAPVPVHMVYFTAWVDDDQAVNFRGDIYGHDARLFQALHHPAGNRVACGAPTVSNHQQAFFTADGRRSDRPPGEERHHGRTDPASVLPFDNAPGQMDSGCDNDTRRADA